MERVIGLPDLLQRIFGFLDLASNSANARVCQQWSDLALDMLWKNVDNPYVLFKILAPLGKSIVSERQGYVGSAVYAPSSRADIYQLAGISKIAVFR